MIIWFIIFILLFIILFFISRVLVKNLYLFFYYLTKNEHWSIQFLTWILLPGTVVHEVSHMLVAELTGIKTGRFSFTPEILEDNQVKAASITMEKPGPFRQSLIGLAPVFFGIGFISLISYFLSIQPFNHLTIKQVAIIIVLFYLLFAISNSMFSSAKDLEQIVLPIILLIILGGAFWLAGIKITFSDKLINNLNSLFKNLSASLAVTIFIDLLLFGLTKMVNSVMMKAHVQR